MSESVNGSSPSVLLTWSWAIVSSIGSILGYLAYGVFVVLHFLYQPVAFLLQPLVFLGRFFLTCLGLPIRIIVQLETVYIYLGVAALVGIFGGLVIRLLSSGLQSILRLDADPAPKGRTVKQYREDKRKQTGSSESDVVSQRYQSPGSNSSGYLSLSEGSKQRRRHKSLLAQTIMEEEDSDF